MKDAKEMSEDDLKRAEKTIDELIARFNNDIEALFKDKEKEILTL